MAPKPRDKAPATKADSSKWRRTLTKKAAETADQEEGDEENTTLKDDELEDVNIE